MTGEKTTDWESEKTEDFMTLKADSDGNRLVGFGNQKVISGCQAWQPLF